MIDKTYKFTHQASDSADDVIKTLDKWGVVHMPRYLNGDTLEGLLDEFFQLLNSEEEWVSKRPNYHAGKERLFRMKPLIESKAFPLTQKVFTAPFMQQVTDGYWGTSNHLNHAVMIHHDLPTPDKGITEVHYDRMTTLKFFIYLKDTDVADGAFACVPGSHLYAQEVRDFYLRRGTRIQDLPNMDLPPKLGEVESIVGPAGTMIIFTTDAYHRGGFVDEGHERYVMRGHTYGKEIPSYLPEKYSPQWWRESAYNPMRYIYKITDPITGARPPEMA